MRIFIINLKKDTERKKFMEDQFQKIGVPYEFFEAFAAKDIPKKELHSLVKEDRIGDPFRQEGEIGCALSHKKIYEKIVAERIQKAVIFEDDIEIDREKFRKVYTFLGQKNNWEYVSLNYEIFDKKWRKQYLWNVSGVTGFGKLKKMIAVFLYMPIEFFQQSFGKIFGPTMFRMLRPLHLTGCYFITYEGAKKLLVTQGEKIQYLADYLQNEAKKEQKLQLYFISPQITRQANEKFVSNTRA